MGSKKHQNFYHKRPIFGLDIGSQSIKVMQLEHHNKASRVLGYEIWVPELPHPEHPDTQEMTEFLINSDWDFNDNLLIGHSSGAVEVLYLLQALDNPVKTAISVSAFNQPVTGMESQHDKMFQTPLDFEKIKAKAGTILFVHGDDDPWCPVQGAEDLAQLTDGELVIVPDGGHFSTSLDLRFTEFNELIKILDERNLL